MFRRDISFEQLGELVSQGYARTKVARDCALGALEHPTDLETAEAAFDEWMHCFSLLDLQLRVCYAELVSELEHTGLDYDDLLARLKKGWNVFMNAFEAPLRRPYGGETSDDGGVSKNGDMGADKESDPGFCAATEHLVTVCQEIHEQLISGELPEVDEERFEVRWCGKACQLGNTQEFWLMQALAEAPGKLVSHHKLAERIGVGERTPIKHVKNRLVKALGGAGMQVLADAIRPETGYYGLLLR